MNTYVLLSKTSLDCNLDKIEREILALSGKKNPVVLFFPFASADYEIASRKFINYFSKYTTNIMIATNNLEEEIKNADILYFGGGNTKKLVDSIKGNKIDLNNLNNKIICGVSAGAIMLCCYGMGDSFSYYDNYHYHNFKMVEGLGLLKYTFCPHYQKDDLIIFNDILKDYNLDGIALEDDTALFIKGNDLRIVKNDPKRNGYNFLKKDNYIMKNFK